MADNSSVEHDEQIDLDGDNDIDEMDDEVEGPGEEDDYRESRDAYAEEENYLEDEGHEKVDTIHDRTIDAPSFRKEEEDIDVSKSEDDSEKHAELLALPPHGSEVFIGGLPRDVTEVDLRELCEPFGEIFEVRLVKDKDTRESKGYAFIVFTARDAALQAIEVIHDKEFKGRTLRCSLSQAKHRLFIGNIPKNMTDEDMRNILEENGPGVENIELPKDAQDPNRNRGFVFVEYYNHACADYSRQKMSNPNFKMVGTTLTVNWADPKNNDTAAATQVKAVYVKNLPESITTEKLKESFQKHGEITKVVLPPAKAGQGKRDFGFIHFTERSSALKAVKPCEKYEIDGNVLEALLAKPQTEKRLDYGPTSHKPGLFPPYSPYSYGYGGDPYGAFGGEHGGGGYGQPVIYGRGPMPSGMRMVPMVLPDGRVGYVLQQPGAQSSPPPPSHRRNDRNGDRREEGRGSDGSHGRRYRPY